MKLAWILRASGAALALGAGWGGCGGKVVVDGVFGEGGAGASSSTDATGVVTVTGVTASSSVGGAGPVGPGPTTNVTAVTTGPGPGGPTVVSTSTGPGGFDESVAMFCDYALGQACGYGSFAECVAEFQEVLQVAGSCTDELVQAVQCLGANVGALKGCDYFGPCEPAIDQFVECFEDDPPDPGGCGFSCSEGPKGACSCEGVCDGDALAAKCTPNGPGAVSCSCAVDGAFVGSCASKPGVEACDLEFGCCAAFFSGGF